MTIAELFDKGGPVVWILFGYSVVALTLVLERFAWFAMAGRPPKGWEQTLVDALDAGEPERALNRARGPESAIVRELLAAAASGVSALGRVASRVGSEQLQRMERGFRTLAILGHTAPLLGLFGTIVGMIKAFMVIEQAGGRVDAQALAGGIWEAMVTTGVGLAVSLPTLLLLHLLEGMADRRAQGMRRYASLVLERRQSGPEADPETAVHHREGVVHAV